MVVSTAALTVWYPAPLNQAFWILPSRAPSTSHLLTTCVMCRFSISLYLATNGASTVPALVLLGQPCAQLESEGGGEWER
jgi:hypothetical protein